MDDAAAGVAALAGEVELAALLAVELRAEGDQRLEAVRAFADHDADRVRVAEAGAGDEGVLDVVLEGVVGGQHRSDPSLGVGGVALVAGAFGEDRDRALLAGFEGEGEPGDAAAEDQKVEGLGHVRRRHIVHPEPKSKTRAVLDAPRRGRYDVGLVNLAFLLRPGALLASLFALSAFAGGGIFKYVEKDGTIVYTNVPPSGPKAAKARRVEGEFRPAPAPSAPARVTMDSKQALTIYDDYIADAAIRYRIPVNLVRAVMHAESAFDPKAVSVVGASGLMQLMPETAQEMYVKDIFDAKDNIEGGVRYLRVLANEFDGDMVKMVAGYNAGPEAVKKYNGQVPPYPETQAYVRKVLSLYFQYKTQSEQQQAAEAAARPAGR